jgi:hypothetical protein
MRLALDIAKILLCAAATFALVELGWVVRTTGTGLATTTQKLTQTLTDVDRATIVAGVTLTELQKGAKEWQKASAQQASQTTTAMSNVNAAATEFTALISRTDSSLNSDIFPAIKNALLEQNQSLLTSEQALTSNLESLKVASLTLEQSLADADKLIADPKIGASMQNIATSTANLAATTADVKQAADHELKVLLTPANKVKQAALFVASIVGKFIQVW